MRRESAPWCVRRLLPRRGQSTAAMASIDETYSLKGYEPNAYDYKETYVEPYTELLTSPQFSKQGFPEDAEYDDAAQKKFTKNW